MTRSRYAALDYLGRDYLTHLHYLTPLRLHSSYFSFLPLSCRRWMPFLPLGITIPLTLFPGILMLIR